jgi:hypothetical protein
MSSCCRDSQGDWACRLYHQGVCSTDQHHYCLIGFRCAAKETKCLCSETLHWDTPLKDLAPRQLLWEGTENQRHFIALGTLLRGCSSLRCPQHLSPPNSPWLSIMNHPITIGGGASSKVFLIERGLCKSYITNCYLSTSFYGLCGSRCFALSIGVWVCSNKVCTLSLKKKKFKP